LDDPDFQFRPVIELDPLFGLSVIEETGVAAIAVLAENQALQPQLHFVCVPNADPIFTDLWCTNFVFDRAGLEPIE
jgi:hypothetical protein